MRPTGREAQIEQAGDARVVEQHVPRAQRRVHVTVAVGGPQRDGQPSAQADHGVGGHGPGAQPLLEGAPLVQGSDEVGAAVGTADLVDLREGGVRETREARGLPPEPQQVVLEVLRRVATEDLQDDLARLALLSVPRQMERAPRATPELADDHQSGDAHALAVGPGMRLHPTGVTASWPGSQGG